MPHLECISQFGINQRTLRHKQRSLYVHNTPEVRDVLANLQRYGYIGKFIAVHEPYTPKHSIRIQNRVSPIRKEMAPYLMVFLKYRLSNKALPVMGGIYYRKRPNRYQIPYRTSKMKVWNQGVGMEFVRRDKESKEWMPAHSAKLRGINAA